MHRRMTTLLDSYFHLRDHNTTVRTELLAGLTTFITITSIPTYNPGPYHLGPLLLQYSPTWGP